ncbi:HNH endonuclease [Ornithinibacillus sp. JPR2-1]|uniref:HNH endonuclease n=1 Tax=Ornithinibacillus sp. JPR2-1 TaxID=2094019 RepID=UPI0031E4365E
MKKRLNTLIIATISSMLLFLSVGPSLALASSVDYNSEISIEEAKDLVEQGYYGSVDDAIFFESMSEEEYNTYLKEFESTFVDENGVYSASYMDDESVGLIEEEVVIIEDESEWELIEGEYDPELIPEDGEYQLSWGWALPAAKAIVKTKNGKKVVKQFLKSSEKWIKVVNGKLAGKKHPKTGVKFNKNGFPVFPRQYQTTLPTANLKSTNATQFKYANKQLKASFDKSPSVRSKFNSLQQQDIRNGKTPRGYVWHHHENRGLLQLVDRNLHGKTGHTGGKSIWGKK